MDCAGGTLVVNEEAGEISEQIEKRESIIGPDHSGCLEVIAPSMIGTIGEIAASDVFAHEVSRGVDVFFDGGGTKSCGCHARPSSGRSLACVRCEKFLAMSGSSRSLHWDTRVCGLRLCRKHTQMRACFC